MLASKERFVETQDFYHGGAASASGLHRVVLGERQSVLVVGEVHIPLSLADTVHIFSLTATYIGIWPTPLCSLPPASVLNPREVKADDRRRPKLAPLPSLGCGSGFKNFAIELLRRPLLLILAVAG